MTTGAGATTFDALLQGLLGGRAGRPLLTFYDDATGERTELSATTYANWVAKVANLMLDEYLLEPGDTVLLDLPSHWLVPVFMGAAWKAGIAVTTEQHEAVHLVVSGPEYDAHRDRDVPTLACSLTPFATRFAASLPDGVDDFGVLWPGQPDAFLGTGPGPVTTSVACRHHTSTHTQGELLDLTGSAEWTGERLLTDVHPTQDCGTTTWLAAWARGGSTVLVRNPDHAGWPARREDERADAEVRQPITR